MSKRNIDILRNGTDVEIAEFLSHFLFRFDFEIMSMCSCCHFKQFNNGNCPVSEDEDCAYSDLQHVLHWLYLDCEEVEDE